ncbi:hypothetical protein [Natrinema salaciae]|uniref:Uncharacterized protein n=1 Tax=Natrinema salaciae TaxID=1186196 RepID=A0A1H9NS65_9EURY|nr:hypothetical protein [Natrinema salaciae]SER38617.1 hypothetical protein SAMN04489841_3710 [Natrinema salaciae]
MTDSKAPADDAILPAGVRDADERATPQSRALADRVRSAIRASPCPNVDRSYRESARW